MEVVPYYWQRRIQLWLEHTFFSLRVITRSGIAGSDGKYVFSYEELPNRNMSFKKHKSLRVTPLPRSCQELPVTLKISQSRLSPCAIALLPSLQPPLLSPHLLPSILLYLFLPGLCTSSFPHNQLFLHPLSQLEYHLLEGSSLIFSQPI